MSRGNKKARTQEGRGKWDNANTNKPIWVNFSNRHTSSYIRFWEFFAKAQFAHSSGIVLTPHERQNACKRRCFRTLSVICILTRLPRASTYGWRWTSCPLPGAFSVADTWRFVRFKFFNCLYYKPTLRFCQVNFKNFFRTGLKTACLRGSEEGGNALDSLGTHKGGGCLARYAEGTNWTLADRTGRRGAGWRSAEGYFTNKWR